MRALFRTGVLGWAHCLWPHRLTVLAYHRIADPQAPDFVGLAANVSASPEQFSAQLDLVRRWFNVISLDQLLDWLAGHAELPRYPLLITFDDGYRDNFGEALPALRARGLPAVLFLATSCVDSGRPFFWDAAAYCFSRTRRCSADLPLLGPRRLDDADARNRALADWLAAAKRLPVAEHDALSRSLQAAVAVEIPVSAFAGQHLNWQHVAELAHSGLAIASHTHSHAILSAATLEEARAEVLGAYRRIEAELGGAPPIFAYPNGQPGDFRGEDIAMLRREGFIAAFTLLEGPPGSLQHAVIRCRSGGFSSCTIRNWPILRPRSPASSVFYARYAG